MPKNNKKIDPITFAAFIIAGIAGIITIFFFVAYGWYFREISFSQEVWGQFGDYIGGVTGSILGLATVLLIVMNIRAQREELKETNKAIAHQNFEQTFFSWLKVYRDIVSAATVVVGSDREKTIHGKEALDDVWWRYFYSHHNIDIYVEKYLNNELLEGNITNEIRQKAINEYQLDGTLPKGMDVNIVVTLILESWNGIYNKLRNHIDVMFRTLYRLIRWVDEQPEGILSKDQKRFYVSIIRGQISNIEMAYLFLNCFTDRGVNFKKHVNNYAIFDNLELDDLKKSGDMWPLLVLKKLECSPFTEGAFKYQEETTAKKSN